MARFAWFGGFNQVKSLSSSQIQTLFGNDVDSAEEVPAGRAMLELSGASADDSTAFQTPAVGRSRSLASEVAKLVGSNLVGSDEEIVGSADDNQPSATTSVQGTKTEPSILAAVASTEQVTLASSPTIIEKRVASGADDAEERSTGSVAIDSGDLELVVDGTKLQTVGIRFTDLDIPRGATITNAYIQFQADKTSSIGAASLVIRGQDSDDATAFSKTKFDVSTRPTTDAATSWTPPEWTVKAATGEAQRTPDLSAIVQEIVDRGGWAALNDMAFIITGSGTRRAEAFEGNAAGAPLLHIEYVMPAGGVPVSFRNPPDADPAANQISELAAAGTNVGITASASDPDPGDVVTYSVNDARFAISASGVLTRSTTGKLDFETEASITLAVTATSSDGSMAIRNFTLGVLDAQEPVAFNSPSDSDGSPNRVAKNAAAGTSVGITASAKDPDAGDTVTYSISDSRFAIDGNGVVTRSTIGTLDGGTSITFNVTARSSDGTSAVESFSLDVTSDIARQLPTSATLVRTVDTSIWSTPSTDPSGIAYITHLGALLISDGDVNETTHFTGDNLFLMSLDGVLLTPLTAYAFSDEPAGVAYNPINKHLYFSDDVGTRAVYELDPGPDGLYNTSDDSLTFFRTRPFGLADAEGVAYDTTRDVLYIAGGVEDRIYVVDPGPNGRFDGVASEGGDDVVTSFSTASFGISDPEGVEYDADLDILYVIASKKSVAMLTPTGDLLGMLDISAAGATKPAGLALAPSSNDPGQMSLYIVDRGANPTSNPNENDGKIYEFLLSDWPMV